MDSDMNNESSLSFTDYIKLYSGHQQLARICSFIDSAKGNKSMPDFIGPDQLVEEACSLGMKLMAERKAIGFH